MRFVGGRAATSVSCWLGRSTITSLLDFAPASARATRRGALVARHLSRAASITLKAMATPAVLDQEAFVTSVPKRTVAKVDSIGVVVLRCTPFFTAWSRKDKSCSVSSTILATVLGDHAP